MLTSVLPWFIAHWIISICAMPLMFRVCTRLYDRGYGLSKVMGLVLVTLGTWWLACLPFDRSWTKFTFSAISVALTFVILLSMISVFSARKDLGNFVAKHWRLLVTYEVLGLVAFALMLSLRATVPHISYNASSTEPAGFVDYAAEKFTDFAILNGLLTSEKFPPHDVWLAGEKLNYYYFGHLMWATMIKYASVRPEIGFNLALASLFALVCQQAFSLGFNLTRRVRWALLAMFLIALASNLDGFLQLVGIVSQKLFTPESARLWTRGGTAWYFSYDFWRSSRAVANTINEFPAFSFVLGDLHGHVSSLSIYLAGLGLSLQIWRSARRYRSIFTYEWHCLDELFYAALITGALYAANSWDAVTYGGVIFMALWSAQAGARNDGAARRGTQAIAAAGLSLLLMLVGIVAIFYPFYKNFKPPLPFPTLHEISRTAWAKMGDLPWPLKITKPELRTDFFEWAAHWVLLLAAPLAWAFVWLKHRAFRTVHGAGECSRDHGVSRKQRIGALFCLAAGTLCTLIPLWKAWVPCLALMACGTCLIAMLRWQPPVLRLMLGWLSLFFGLCWFCELFYFDDIFSAPIERINTVFKIYYNLWPLAALCSVMALRRLVRYGASGSRRSRGWWLITPLLICAGTYMIMAPIQRIAASAKLGVSPRSHRMTENKSLDDMELPAWAQSSARARTMEESLDGMRYLKFLHASDYDAIRWIRQNTAPNATVLEAAGSQYTYAGRIGTMTGRPVFAGWLMHDLGWRGEQGWTDDEGRPISFLLEVQRRTNIARDVYETTSALAAHALLRANKIEYVVVGDAEREQYPALNELEVAHVGQIVFDTTGTAIYKVAEEPPMWFTPPQGPEPTINIPTEILTEQNRLTPMITDDLTTASDVTTFTKRLDTVTTSLPTAAFTTAPTKQIFSLETSLKETTNIPPLTGQPWD